MQGVIPSPGSVGALFAIDRSQWVAINDRVRSVIEAQTIAAEISRIITNYQALLGVCSQWKSTTFPGLIAQAVQVNLFAQQAVQDLIDIRNAIAGLSASDPAPFIYKVRFAALADLAGQFQRTTATLASVIAAFVSENRTTDAILDRIGQSLGPLWQSIAGPIGQLEGAISDVQSDWSAIDTILTAGAVKTNVATVGDLQAANIPGAINQWQALQTVTLAFDSMVTNLT